MFHSILTEIRSIVISFKIRLEPIVRCAGLYLFFNEFAVIARSFFLRQGQTPVRGGAGEKKSGRPR